MLFFKKRSDKKKAPPREAVEQLVASRYLLQKENQKAKNLADHLQIISTAPEEKECFLFLKNFLAEKLPGYTFESFVQVQKDASKGLFKALQETDQETLLRMAQYGRMVQGFPVEMASGVYGEALFELFRRAKENRLIAYHLFQLADHLQREISSCMAVGIQQLMRGALVENGYMTWQIAPEDFQKLIRSLSVKEKKILVEGEAVREHLERLSIELARIMVYAISQTIAAMKEAKEGNLVAQDSLVFEKEAGIEALQEKIRYLREVTQSLHVESLKKQMLKQFA